MTLLARWRDEWFLAQRGPKSKGCSLIAGGTWVRIANLGATPHRVLGRNGWMVSEWVVSLSASTDVVFYPELRYHGYRIWPLNWKVLCDEPILACYLDLAEVSAGTSSASQTKERINILSADGWQWQLPDGGYRFVHVDDLTKTEGPPPEGAF